MYRKSNNLNMRVKMSIIIHKIRVNVDNNLQN